MVTINESEEGISFAVRVHPRARRDGIIGELGDAVKLALKAPPVDGRANEACIEFFAAFLKVPRSSISIVSGEKARRKVINIKGVTADGLRQQLAAAESSQPK